MDPDETLEEIRELCDTLERQEERDNDFDFELVNELIEKIRALDEWLVRDGFLPADWREFPKVEQEESGDDEDPTQVDDLLE